MAIRRYEFENIKQVTFFSISPETKFINPVNYFPQIIAALDAIFQLAEDFAYFVLDGGQAFDRSLKGFEVGKKLPVDKFFKIFTSRGIVMVYFSIGFFWGSPGFPTLVWGKERGIGFT